MSRLLLLVMLALAFFLSSGCATLRQFGPSVQVKPLTPAEYIELKRGDVLSGGNLSASTRETLRMTGLDTRVCGKPNIACIDAMSATIIVSEENKRGAMAELWLQYALSLRAQKQSWMASPAVPSSPENPLDAEFVARLDAWMAVARESFAYLFFSERTPGERGFVDRQIQVRDYYNLAVEEASVLLFEAASRGAKFEHVNPAHSIMRVGKWTFHIRTAEGDRDIENWKVRQLIPASSMFFKGRLRRFHRRDGVGAELVAITDDAMRETRNSSGEAGVSVAVRGTPPNVSRDWSQIPTPAVSTLMRFSGRGLAEVLMDEAPELTIYDPYKVENVEVNGHRVPLAANFSAAYGLWLARSNFSRQAMESLFGRKGGIDKPHMFLMQPYDPNRRVILMIHGLASSPEAWVNVANELMRDDEIRSEFQIWQMYYPTSMPIPLSHAAIRKILGDAALAFDPSGEARASSGVVVIGHSMGGVISRLLVSSSGDAVWNAWVSGRNPSDHRSQSSQTERRPLTHFEPLENIERVVFVATPHRGTDVTRTRMGRWISYMIQVPESALRDAADLMNASDAGYPEKDQGWRTLTMNSLDSLDRRNPFMRATADLSISPTVQYHSIIARRHIDGPLEESTDGLVPYWSSHLVGAQSEMNIHSGHSVQEHPQAINELRRILREDAQEFDAARPK